MDLVLRNAKIVTAEGVKIVDIAVEAGKIASIGEVASKKAKREIDCEGFHVLPCVIDMHVHFLETGIT